MKKKHVVGAGLLAVTLMPGVGHAIYLEGEVPVDVEEGSLMYSTGVAVGSDETGTTSLEGALEASVLSATTSENSDMTLSVIMQSGLLTSDLKSSLAAFNGPITPLVQSKADVHAYGNVLAEVHPSIERVSFTSSKLSVEFKESGRAFWLIPVEMTSTVEVAADGSVTVRRPWYSPLVRIEGNADIASDVTTKLGSNAEVSIRAFAANAEAVHQAELIRSVVAGVEASAEGSVVVE